MLTLARPESRRALADFVRTRRERLRPEEVGLPPGARRRTPGLRREEVAQLAGVGVTWYTWFEQGRDIQVSTHFLENLCRALRLDRAERTHLFALAQDRPPPLATPVVPALSAPVQAMLMSLPHPAYIKTSRWDVVAWNPAAASLLCDFSRIPPEERNTLWLVFTDPQVRRIMGDWEGDARRALAKFRLDHGRSRGDPAFEALVERLSEASAEFRLWWPSQDVSDCGEGVKRIRHGAAGEIEFQHAAFLVEGAPELRLIALTPATEEDARRAGLAERAPTGDGLSEGVPAGAPVSAGRAPRGGAPSGR